MIFDIMITIERSLILVLEAPFTGVLFAFKFGIPAYEVADFLPFDYVT